MSEEKTIWVTGANGWIGSEVVTRFERMGYTIAATDAELSVCEADRIEAFASEVQPYAIVNCAGIPREATGIANRIKAYEVNALGARNLAVAANSVGALLVQISTDDVYPARMAEPANEFDTPHPETAYGKSKRAGEVMVRDTTSDSLIIRSSWVYSLSGGQLKRALDAASEGRVIEARTDQYASPTSVAMYVHFIERAIARRLTGTLHITASGLASRYEFLSKALEISGYDPTKVLKPTEDLVTAEKLQLETLMLEMFGADIPTWEEDLATYLASTEGAGE